MTPALDSGVNYVDKSIRLVFTSEGPQFWNAETVSTRRPQFAIIASESNRSSNSPTCVRGSRLRRNMHTHASVPFLVIASIVSHQLCLHLFRESMSHSPGVGSSDGYGTCTTRGTLRTWSSQSHCSLGPRRGRLC